MNYIGYFRSLDNNDQYRVKLITNTADTEYTEVKLAGESPFVVTYNESQTPFDPVRTSTAVLRMVHNNYLEDIYSPYAQGTQVILENVSLGGEVEWVGYLVPRIYNQGYEDCFETVEIEAADCISSLQYFDYQIQGTSKAIVTIKSVINSICNKCGLLDSYTWTRSKKVTNAILLPEHLMISEQNFFSSDTDEPWKLSTVLEEICRYFGFTAIQDKQSLMFIDLEYFSDNENLYYTQYYKNGGYSAGYNEHGPNPFTVTEETYRGSGANISFEPIYNKVTVKDNFYIAEDAIPSIYEDKYLTNSFIPCNFYATYEVTPETPDKARYPWKGNTRTESVGDSQYKYWHRPFTHEYWQSHYYDTAGTEYHLIGSLGTIAAVKDYVGATIMDLITAKDIYYETSPSPSRQKITSSKKDEARYICISQKGCEYNNTGGSQRFGKPLLELKTGFKTLCPFSSKAYLVINYSAVFEKYENRAYINPEWTSETVYTDFEINSVGAKVPKYNGYDAPQSNCGDLKFRVTIGDAWWQQWRNVSGGHIEINAWNTSPTSSTTYLQDSIFNIDSRWHDNAWQGVVQNDIQTNNTVSWEDNLNVEGYKIPLQGVDMEGDIKIEIFLPSLQFSKGFNDRETKYNQYCWIKDLTITIVEPSEDGEGELEADVVYENVIDQDAINELSEITVKLTTKAENTKPSYSNVVYKRSGKARLLDEVKEDAISGVSQKPEENIIEKYVKQYSTPTKKIQATQVLGVTPVTKVYGVDVENPEDPYVILGNTIDYANGSQTITMVQLK